MRRQLCRANYTEPIMDTDDDWKEGRPNRFNVFDAFGNIVETADDDDLPDVYTRMFAPPIHVRNSDGQVEGMGLPLDVTMQDPEADVEENPDNHVATGHIELRAALVESFSYKLFNGLVKW